MDPIEALSYKVDQITAFWAIHAQNSSFFIAQNDRKNSLPISIAVIIESADDLFF